MLELTRKGDEIKELKYKSEKGDHEKVLKSLKFDKHYYKRKN